MRIAIAAVGKLKQGPERELFQHYWQRLEAAGRGVALSPLRHDEIAESRAANVEARKRDETDRLIKTSGDCEICVALDGAGKALSSEAFAAWLRSRRDAGAKGMSFLIGGPDGHGRAALEAAQLVLSLGPMTLTHGLARVVLAEQLYRSATLIAGHPYHRA